MEVEEVEDVPPEEPPVPLLDDELKLADSRFEAWKFLRKTLGEMDLFKYVAACCFKPFLLCGAGKVAEMNMSMSFSSTCPSSCLKRGQTKSRDAMRFSF